MNKKGLGLGEMPNVAVSLVLVAAVFAAGFLVIAGLQNTQVTGAAGCNSTTQASCSQAYWAANNMSQGMTNVVNYSPTWGVIIGVAVLLGIVLAGFGFAKTKGYI